MLDAAMSTSQAQTPERASHRPLMSCDVRSAQHVGPNSSAGRTNESASSTRWRSGGAPGSVIAPRDDVVRRSRGAELARIEAAAAETGVVRAMGEAVAARVDEAAESEATIRQVGADVIAILDGAGGVAESAMLPAPGGAALDAHRDDLGRFTSDYNRAVRGVTDHDPRRDADHTKRGRRQVDELILANWSSAVIGQKLLAIGAAPLLTERRGFDGLEGPTVRGTSVGWPPCSGKGNSAGTGTRPAHGEGRRNPNFASPARW